MKAKYSRRHFLKMATFGLGAAFLAGCDDWFKPEPTPVPTILLTPTDTLTPQPTITSTPTITCTPTSTSTPEPVDTPIYKNIFEGMSDPAASGITSANNAVRVNTENVEYQSGSQSLEAYGTIAAPIYSTLTVEMSIHALTGQETVDLSNKTVCFSWFVPAGSPISSINLVAKSGTKVVALVAAGSFAASKWHYQQFDLKSTYENNSWIWTDLSNDDARDVIRNCREIIITGMRPSDGAATPTSFLIDDFKWIGMDDFNHIRLDDAVDSIRKYANLKHMIVGSVVIKEKNYDFSTDPWYMYTLAQEFNMTTVGGAAAPQTKPADLGAVVFDYTNQDQMLVFAESNSKLTRGGTGGWSSMNPMWILDATYDELKTYLEHKVEQDMSHFKGKMISWGIFNEVINDDGDGFRNRQNKYVDSGLPPDEFAPYGYLYSPWVDGTDTSLIEAAFIKARQVDADAKLILNEFENEEIGAKKSEFFYKFVTGMKNRDVPIDGVGFELHLMYPSMPWMSNPENLEVYLNNMDRNIKRYAEAGLLVEFTEMEVNIRMDGIDLATQDGREEHERRLYKQADIFAGLMKLAVANPNVLSVTFWNALDDSYVITPTFKSEEKSYLNASLLDKNCNPKPAYYAVLDVLKS